jgi:hypothetical protein
MCNSCYMHPASLTPRRFPGPFQDRLYYLSELREMVAKGQRRNAPPPRYIMKVKEGGYSLGNLKWHNLVHIMRKCLALPLHVKVYF